MDETITMLLKYLNTMNGVQNKRMKKLKIMMSHLKKIKRKHMEKDNVKYL